MELGTNLGSIDRISRKGQSQLTGSQPRRRIHEDPEKRVSTIDARISSLRILAQSLIRQIELLEQEAAGGSENTFDAQNEVRRFEAELIRSALIRTGGRQRRAARLLGMKVTTLNTKIKRYRITLDGTTIVHEQQIG